MNNLYRKIESRLDSSALTLRSAEASFDLAGFLVTAQKVGRALRQSPDFAASDIHGLACVVVSERHSLKGLLLAFGAMLEGFVPRFRPHNPRHTGAQAEGSLFATLPGLPSLEDLALAAADLADVSHARFIAQTLFAQGNSPVLCFSTSGSTGQGQDFFKDWRGLLAEAECLAKLFDLSRHNRIVSLVPPFHIYGFLYGFLLPVLSGSEVCYVDDLLTLPQSVWAPNATSNVALVVGVPSMWPIMRRYIGPHTRCLVSSGAKLGHEKETDFLALKNAIGKELGHSTCQLSGRNAASLTRLVEVLGSTETGGLGYRWVEGIDEGVFTPFPGVALSAVSTSEHATSVQTTSTVLTSSFVYPAGQSVILADKLELFENGRFGHAGRTDRVFKWAGVRYLLDDVEQNLSSLSNGKLVVCHFVEDNKHPKGGELVAFIEGQFMGGVVSLRERYNKDFSTPFPEKVFALLEFPRNSMGKVTLKELYNVTQAKRS